MSLQEKLELGLSCFEEVGNLPRRKARPALPSSQDMLGSCLFAMRSFNEGIIGDRCLNQMPSLPLLRGPQPDAILEYASKNSRSTMQIPKRLAPTSPHLTQNLVKHLQERQIILQRRADNSTSDKPQLNSMALFRKPRLRSDGLSPQQRYFENQKVQVGKDRVKQLGVYEAANRFKPKNIKDTLDSMKLVAEHIKLEPITAHINHQDLFMTNIQQNSHDFGIEEFIQSELTKEQHNRQVVSQCHQGSKETTRNQSILGLSPIQGSTGQTTPNNKIINTTYLVFERYSIVENEDYRNYKCLNLTEWPQLKASIEKISQCLKNQKICYYRVNTELLPRWHGKRVTQDQIMRLLGLSCNQKAIEKVQNLILAFRDRLKVRKVRQQNQKKENLARWAVQRMKTFCHIRKARAHKIKTAYEMNRSILKDFSDWEVEVHLPSFSLDEFHRHTTQYMESFENLYHGVWEETDRHLILVMPTLNQHLFALLQNKLKSKRSLTIVCPQVHENFPTNLPLAAHVYFSSETLEKILTAIAGRKAVIVPASEVAKQGYQLLISEYLGAPILYPLELCNDLAAQRAFFDRASIPTIPHGVVSPLSTMDCLLETMIRLLLRHPQESSWVFKMNGEFRGRGIATIKLNHAKYMENKAQVNDNEGLLGYLRRQLKLRLKVNFENSLFSVDDYLQFFLRYGGVIEIQTEVNQTYELCFQNEIESSLIMTYKSYGVHFSNKAWMSQDTPAELLDTVYTLKKRFKEERYIGFVTATLLKDSKGSIYGVDIKLGKSFTSSIAPLLHTLNRRRDLTTETVNINSLPTILTESPPPEAASTHYLVIPHLLFTDLDEEVKAKLIEETMEKCWMSRHLSLSEDFMVYLSCGLDFSLLLAGVDLKRLKKKAIDTVRELADRAAIYKEYRGKQVVRDVFQAGDIIRAVSQIKTE